MQKHIRTEYEDGQVVISNIRKKKPIPVIGINNTYSATKVINYYDGSPMDDSKVDGLIYLKLKETGEYFRVDLPQFGLNYLNKDTVEQLLNLSTVEVLLLKMGYYKGVMLFGYYEKGDTPSEIVYHLSDTAEVDDGGSIFEVGGIKLEHEFIGQIDVRYYGIIGVGVFTDIEGTPDITDRVQRAEDYRLANDLQLVWNTSGYMKITDVVRLGNQINWVNPVIGTRDDPNFKIFVTTGSLFERKTGVESPNLYGIFKGICLEFFSVNSVNTSIGKNERINSIAFNNFSFYGLDFSWNWFRHFGTILYGGISNLTNIYQNRIRNSWRALVSPYKEGESSQTSVDYSLTDSRVFNNYFTSETSVDNTSFIKGNSWGHTSIYANFIDFTEAIFDNSEVDLSLYCTGSKFYGNTLDYCINLSKGNLSFLTCSDNHIMNMSVRSATTITPAVNWGLYGTDRVKTMEWGLFKDAGRLSYILFVNNRIEHLDFIVKSQTGINYSSVRISDNGWYKSTNNGRASNDAYTISELRAKIKTPSVNVTFYPRGKQNDFSDLGYISDRITPLLGVSQKASSVIDTVTQIGAYRSSLIDDVRGISFIGDTDAYMLRKSNSGKAVFIESKRDSKIMGRRFAYEIADDLVNGRFYEGDIVNCQELGELTYSIAEGLTDGNGVKRIINAQQLIDYTGSANVLSYVYDLGAFVQLFNASSKPWRGNNVLASSQITSISSSINTFGTSLPTTQMVPDRPFILLDGSGVIVSLHKVNSDYEWVVYDPTTKIRYDELLRDYGTTSQRPKYFISNGFEYFNTDLNIKQIYNGTQWVQLVPDATTANKGVVNQSTNVDDVASANTVADTASTATDVTEVVTDLNDLIDKYNAMSTLVNELKTKLNAKLGVDRTSGQQSAT